MRLDRLLVTLAQGSRTQVQKMIRAGSVTVDGKVIRDPSFDVSASAAVALNARLLDTRLTRHLMLHKPAGILTAAREKIAKAKEYAVSCEYPDPSEFLTDVYAE